MSRRDQMHDGRKPGYAVGYGRPPEGSRFRPGQSGNPSGRPRGRNGRKDLSQLLDDLFTKRLTVTENGQRRSIAAIEAVLTTMLRAALRGDTRATSQLLKLAERYPPQSELTRTENDVSAQIRDKIDRMAKNMAAGREREEQLVQSPETCGFSEGTPPPICSCRRRNHLDP
jgi:hypothetical protein